MSVDPMNIVAVLIAYVMGSVPTGLWLGLRLRGVDIREHGSKNIGATNTLRVLGKGLGSVALVSDIAKGVIPVLLVSRLGSWEHLPLACGVAAILGHSFSLFLMFKGGKGVATSAGVFASLATYPFLIAFAVFFSVVAITRMVSAGSILAAVSLGVGVFFFPLSLPIQLVTVLVAVLVVWKHRTNVGRIFRGEESKLGAGSK